MPSLEKLEYKLDSRGFGLYNLFSDVLPGQVNCTTTQHGVVRAFHKHNKQIDRWVCVKGNIHVILIEELNGHELNKYDWHKYVRLNTDEHIIGLPILTKFGFYAGHETIAKITHHHIGERNQQVLTIPPGIYHGFTPLYNQDATLLYYADKKYNPNDELRLRYDFFGESLWSVENK